jgi:hypothetical protein
MLTLEYHYRHVQYIYVSVVEVLIFFVRWPENAISFKKAADLRACFQPCHEIFATAAASILWPRCYKPVLVRCPKLAEEVATGIF